MPSDTGTGNIDIWRGENDPPVGWQFLLNDIADDATPQSGDLFDLTGSQLYLTIYYGDDGKIEKNTMDNPAVMIIDLAQATLTWKQTVDETRLLPLGSLAYYEIERRIADKQGNLASGKVNVRGGRNND